MARRLCHAAPLPDTRASGPVLFLANCSLLLLWRCSLVLMIQFFASLES